MPYDETQLIVGVNAHPEVGIAISSGAHHIETILGHVCFVVRARHIAWLASDRVVT
jgi:hypothetical protein